MPSSERVQAAILHAELRNFMRSTTMLEAAIVLQLASEFFSLASRAATLSGGRVMSVQNNALVTAFSSGKPAQFAQQALQAAQIVQREFGPLGDRWKLAYGFQAAAALGLHIGETVFGMAGPAGAEQDVAFGDTVSIAQRLVHRARAGEIVLSSAIMSTVGGTSGTRPLPPLELGRRPPMVIYGILLDTRLDFT